MFFLGVAGKAREEQKGVEVMDVMAGSAAAASDIQPGDIITEVGGKKVGTYAELADAVSGLQAAETRIMLLRGSRAIELKVTLGAFHSQALGWVLLMQGDYDRAIKAFLRAPGNAERRAGERARLWGPKDQGLAFCYWKQGDEDRASELWGKAYVGITLAPMWTGAKLVGVVSHVENESPASASGLRRYDILLEYANKDMSVDSLEEWPEPWKLVSETPIALEVPVKVMRHGKIVETTVKPELHPFLRD